MIDKMSRCLENSLRFFFSCQGQIFSRGKGLGVNKVPVLPPICWTRDHCLGKIKDRLS